MTLYRAVSYTHLDVYKRQVKAKGIAKMEGKAEGSHYFALTPEEVEQALKENGGTDDVDA